jgi:DNA polymerase I-like protein with 3'-5' exonuclease and polymerase domains
LASIPWFVSSPDPNIYKTGRYIVLDFETTSRDKGSAANLENQLVLACWYTSWDEKWHVGWGSEYEQQKLVADVEQCDFIVAQFAKFELSWLDRIGIDLRSVFVYDTFLAEWVIAGNRQFPKDLGSMLKARGYEGKEDLVAGMIELGIDPLNIPRPMLEYYCLQDVRGTLELFLDQLETLVAQEQLHLVYTRCLLTPVLVDMEKQGIYLDKDEVYKEYYKVVKEYEDTKAILDSFGEINWNSRQQVGALLYDELGFEELKGRDRKAARTPAGGRKTDVATLSNLKATTKEQRSFLKAYQKLADLQAKLSKNLNFYKAVCEHYGCIFFGNINQGRTGTHRLSSSGRKVVTEDGDFSAQLQNQPREYKRLVKAREVGWEVWEADGSQIEFRVAADMGGPDPVAAEEIANDADVHSTTAKILLENGEEGFDKLDDKEQRQEAKPTTFRPLYGGSSGTEAQQAYCKFFREKYRGIFDEQTAWSYDVLRDGQLRTPYGMIFYWPGTKINRWGKIDNTTAIFNYPVQGFATAEIIPIVLVYLWHRLRGFPIRFILTVHDSIILEVAPSVDKELLEDVIARAFTQDVYFFLEQCYGYTFKVPLGCEIKHGEHWGEGKGKKVKMYNDGKHELIWK